MRWVRELKNIAQLTASEFAVHPLRVHMQLAVTVSRAPHLRRAAFSHYERSEAQFMALYGAQEPRQPEGII